MSRFFLVCGLLLSFAAAAGGEIAIHDRTAPVPDARYEIVQSTLAVKNTFRLDRFTGRVALLVQTENGWFRWREMEVENLADIDKPLSPRFEIFTSGIAAKSTFLIDSVTGRTWIVVGSETTKWQEFAQ